MPTKLNVESFVSIVKKSGLVASERLEQIVNEFSGTADDDPSPLAALLVSRGFLTKWQAEKLLQGKHRGFFLGKYKLLSLLGKGGMSSVYLAEHLTMRRRCALKVLPAKRVADSSYLERFHREAQAIALLDHPNIVRAYDMDHQADGNQQIHFLVMELVEGRSILELVGETGMESFLDAAEYVRQAAAGLQHAHEQGMVHRDIKPGNLLVDHSGLVKILDLGLARFFTADEGKDALTLRHDERVLGTADYLSPEQAIDSHTVDARADIYSLGCTFYFMLTGQPPFPDGTLAQRLLAHQIKTPPPVESIRRDVPPLLAAAVRRMMEKRPENRFPTAASVESALFHWIDQTADSNWRRVHSRVYEPRKNDSGSVKIALPISQLGQQHERERPADSWSDHPSSSVLNPSESASEHAIDSQETAIHPVPLTPTKSEIEQIRERPSAVPVSIPVRERTKPDSAKRYDASFPAGSPESSLSFLVFETEDAPKSVAASIRTARPSPILRNLSRSANWLRINRKSPAVVGAMAILFIAIVAGLYLASSSGRLPWRDASAHPFLNGKQEVTVGPKHCDFTRIRDALIAVRERYEPRAGNRDQFIIHVQPGTYRERIRIDGRGKPWPEGIVIRGEPGAIIEAIDTQPVIRIANVSRFCVESMQIEARQNPTAVELADELHESSLRQVTVQGFTDVGIDCQGAQGLSFGNNQLVLEQIEFEPAGSNAVGIRLADGTSNDISNVTIRRCRFLKPLQAGIVVDGKSLHGVEISLSLFDSVTDGIRVEHQAMMKSLIVLNNTFHDVSCGIRFAVFPNELSSDLVIRRNLFSNVHQAESLVPEPLDANLFRQMLAQTPVGIEHNWSDRVETPPVAGENLVLFENGGRRGVTGLAFASTDPKDPEFLAPTAKSPQRETSGSHPNDRQWVGAIGPR
ncbi:serine/threonine-protein kinase [Schlesneria paludicola]|uniref:serine/threonine-protein kinase n=1 Tax=Schlesneria paludicola TaxID=360056 RepID=UPI00029A7669|nr:serine/threonine-protein kinase [Schlesneria paludicola]